MLTVNAAIYKDVNAHDFNHYFGNTAMAWKLSATKRRLFIVTGLAGDKVSGTYLTREKEFKNKLLDFKNWWDSLDPIVLQPLMFNLPGGCAVWQHQLAKNLRKSFPWAVNQVQFFGDVKAENKTMQVVSASAFSELYGIEKNYYPLRYVMYENHPAMVTKEKFLVDRNLNRLYFHNELIGQIKDNKITLPKSRAVFASFLQRLGVSSDDMIIVPDPEPKPAPEDIGAKHQKFNPNWVEGYHPELAMPKGYAVMFNRHGHEMHGKIRTYKGTYPGNENLSPFWAPYNYWGQE